MPQKNRRDTVTVSIRLDRKVHAKLRRVVDEQKRPLTEFATAAIIAALATCPTCGRDHEAEKTLRGRVATRTERP